MAKNLSDPLTALVRKHGDYPCEAYEFIFTALEFSIKTIGKKRHISGQELLEGIKQCARDQFGLMALVVFHHWGVYKTDDFGEIVFRLVDAGLLGKTEHDFREDFNDGYDFEKTFRSG